jgi:hemoglobin/transferrin/lactoferrin receptor protein
MTRQSFRAVLFSASAIAAFAVVVPAFADEAAVADATVEQVVVTATRSEKPVDELPVTASVITSEQIDDRLATDIKDLVKYEPGVSVRTAPGRFNAAGSGTGRDGNAGFNIRGLEGNRVLIMVDGIRTPDAFDFGAQNVGRGGYADLGIVKSVEIVRGPASALYGSDGLAGSVSFFTKDPEDVLRGDRDWATEARAGYASADESTYGSLLVAGRAGAWQGLVSYTRREGSEQETMGTQGGTGLTRTEANPQALESNAILAKLVFDPIEGHTFRLTYDHLDSEMDADVLSARTATTTRVLAHDETDRDRVSLDYHFSAGEGLFSDARLAVYYQDSTTSQYTFEDRTSTDRTRLNTFDNQVWGASVQITSEFQTGGVGHSVVWGGDWSKTRQEQIRGGTAPTPPDVFPGRAFPNTDYSLAGLYVQDEIKLLDGRVSLYPALRYDWYELEPEDDALYTGPAPVGQSDSQLSPKLGVVWTLTDNVELFGNVAMGFKAPSPSQVNTSFSNPLQGYTSISNPDLKPEKSETAELGLRWKSDRLYVQVSAYTGKYEDFISREAVSGSFSSPPVVYQFVNFSDVELNGVEARARLILDESWTINAAIAATDGEIETATGKAPLASINPTQFAGGLSWRDPAGRFGAELSLIVAAAKDQGDAGTSFAPPSFGVLDLTGFWNVNDSIVLRGGVFNLADEKYWYWSDVRGIAPTSVEKDAFTMPGRNVGVSLTLKL